MKPDPNPEKLPLNLKRLLLWSTVFLYTAALPQVILIYRWLSQRLSEPLMAGLPLFILAIFIGFAIFRKPPAAGEGRQKRRWGAAAAIILAVFCLEPNPNKRIHLPEYLLLVWLIQAALADDDPGRGAPLLIGITAILLGISDELLQGIHPGRHFGLSDLGVNAAGVFLGLLLPFRPRAPGAATGQWPAVRPFFRGSIIFIGFGLAGVLSMLPVLDHIAGASSGPDLVYPGWLLGWHLLFLTGLGLFLPLEYFRLPSRAPDFGQRPPANRPKVLPWILLPSICLMLTHGLALLAVLTGLPFQ